MRQLIEICGRFSLTSQFTLRNWLKKEPDEVKKVIKENKLELAEEMFPEIFGQLKPEDL